jgi:glycolate oxidase FAD binding subunit
LPSASRGLSAEPLTVAEASELLARASREGTRVSIERDGGDVVLATRYLNRLLEHEAGDLTATVEAGIHLSALNARLAGHGQMLALDPPGDPTIGATIAGDLFGPRAHRYGRPRDLLLGVTLVLADGTIANSGGKVVKNVAGYDLGKLVCGSHGRLALVARASFRLHPCPASSRSIVIPAATAAEARRLVQLLLHSPLTPSAVDLLWGGSEPALVLLFEGGGAAVDDQAERALALLGGREDDAGLQESAARQLAAAGRGTFELRELEGALGEVPEALVRIGATCVAYLPQAFAEPWSPLAERVRVRFDPGGVLA